ncbi:MAG: PD40 domain-containing protein [Clostridia bacterium]|nr:PD40 domain-containing protein [Clostridia bacterium]
MSEKYTYIDRACGTEVTRLTSYRSNSNHLYFTNNCFYDGGKKIVFASERGNAHNLFSLELESGIIEQLTDFAPPPNLGRYELHMSFVDYSGKSCVFFIGKELMKIDLVGGEISTLYRVPEGFKNHIVSIDADGKYAYTSVYEDSPEKRKGNTLTDFYLSHPHSKIERIALDGSGHKTVFEENNFIAHVNTSPTDSGKLTFCHEGGWDVVDHRLWTLDINTGTVSKLHPCAEGEVIGHEYWFADGWRIGYHGHRNGKPILGSVNFDNTCDRSYEFPFRTGHIFSFDEKLIIGDGDSAGKYLRLWQLRDGKYEQPRALCLHASSFKTQESHVHPRLTPDGKKILYTSDESGHNQIYLASLPDDLDTLPYLSTVSKY